MCANKVKNRRSKNVRRKGSTNLSKKISKKLSSEQEKEITKLLIAPRTEHYEREKLSYDEYHDLEFQRLRKSKELKDSILGSSFGPFNFSSWIRSVTFKYSSNPLSSRGSVNSIGGRFNIGSDIQDSNFTSFNALYLAEDILTSLFEMYGVKNEGDLDSALQVCFTNRKNLTIVNVSGNLNRVLDIDQPKCLDAFVKELSKVTFSSDIIDRRKKMGIKDHSTIKTSEELLKSLYYAEWRYQPQIHDIPSNSQVFGQIAYRAGIEAILYTSVKNGKKCMAIFPKNLTDTSVISIDGDLPDFVKKGKLDSLNIEDFL